MGCLCAQSMMSWFASCLSHLPWAASLQTSGSSAFILLSWLHGSQGTGARWRMCHSGQGAQGCKVTENNSVVKVVYKTVFPWPPLDFLWLLLMKTSDFQVTRLSVIHRKPPEGTKCTAYLKTTVLYQVSISTKASVFQEHISNSISVRQNEQVPYSFYISQKKSMVVRYPAQITQPVNKARNGMQVWGSWC